MEKKEMDKVKVRVTTQGMKFVYKDNLKPLLNQGQGNIKRASHVEPTPDNKWTADMGIISPGIILGPFETRQEALNAETQWLDENF